MKEAKMKLLLGWISPVRLSRTLRKVSEAASQDRVANNANITPPIVKTAFHRGIVHLARLLFFALLLPMSPANAQIYDVSTGEFKATLTFTSPNTGTMVFAGSPGTDPVTITKNGAAITIVRDCRPLSGLARCSQTWTGTISGSLMSGTWSGTGGSAPWTAALRGGVTGTIAAALAQPQLSAPGAGAGKFDGTQGYYWKSTYNRAPKPIHACSNGTAPDAGLCYQACPYGGKGVGPLCHATCPAGYEDTLGVSCKKPGNVNVLYTLANMASQAACNQIGRGTTCVQKAARWPFPAAWVPYITGTQTIFQPCPNGFEGTGDSATCKPKCPQNFRDDGLYCAKPVATPRLGADGVAGRGTPMGCAPGEDYDAGLCYPANSDPSKYSCIGPVCWMKVPPGYVDCGAGVAKTSFICATTTAAQTQAALEFSSKFVPVIGAVASTALSSAINAASTSGPKAKAAAKVASEMYKKFDALGDAAKKLVKGGPESQGALVSIKKTFTSVYSNLDDEAKLVLKAGGDGLTLTSAAAKAYLSYQPDAMSITRTMADLLGLVPGIDHFGLFGVISAYTYPVWGVDYPF